MNILGFSSGMYGWYERHWMDFKEEPSLDEIFRSCAEAGLDAVEVDAQPEIVQLAKSYGLAISGSYIGLPLHESSINIEETVMPVARRLSEVKDRKSTRLNSSHVKISYAVFCLK